MHTKSWLAFLLALVSSFAFALDQTSTGFYYPIGKSNFDQQCGTWLGRDSQYGGCYLKDYYHVGVDMMTRSTNADVYAIADGGIVSVDSGADSWGSGNCGVFIRHQKANGDGFIALYGHLRCSTIPSNPWITAGQSIGKTGNYPAGGIHLHFGIHDGPFSTMARSGWGRMPNTAWDSPNTFTDPIAFIRNNAPYTIQTVTKEIYIVDITDYYGIGWSPTNVSCENATHWYNVYYDSTKRTAVSTKNSICSKIPSGTCTK